jgi:nucleoside-diphosphate kinase
MAKKEELVIPADPEKLEVLRRERTLVLIKPDAVMRKLVGEIIGRFEKKGLKIIAMKMQWPTDAQVNRHYTDSEEWLKSSGQRTYDGYLEKGVEPPAKPRDLALNTRRKLIESLQAGPVVALVIEGAHSIEVVRKMRGATSPLFADVGTIGFDYSLESYELADAGNWAIKNIIHASDSPENAQLEMDIWFGKGEIHDYISAEDHILYTKDW